jgi:hypothetical protein
LLNESAECSKWPPPAAQGKIDENLIHITDVWG